MKKVLCILFFVQAFCANAQTVQYGIFSSGTSLVVKAKPSGVSYTTANFLTDVVFTIRWSSSYGTDLGSSSSSYSVVKTGSEGTSGGFEYQKFVLSGGSPINLPEDWDSGSEYTLLTVPVGQTGGSMGTFELAPNGFVSGGDANIAIDLTDVINGSSPFYQSSTEVPLPITLVSFQAAVLEGDKGVRLDWATESEIGNYGFYVQRRLDEGEEFADLAESFVPGHGTTTEAHEYSFVDGAGGAGVRHYRLKQVDLDKTIHYSEPITIDVLTDVEEVAPPVFTLHQNYPNPFNPATVLKFSVEKTGPATVRLYNVAGQEVRTLFEGVAEVGRYYRLQLDARNLASGVYLYRLRTENNSDIKKMVLLK